MMREIDATEYSVSSGTIRFVIGTSREIQQYVMRNRLNSERMDIKPGDSLVLPYKNPEYHTYPFAIVDVPKGCVVSRIIDN